VGKFDLTKQADGTTDSGVMDLGNSGTSTENYCGTGTLQLGVDSKCFWTAKFATDSPQVSPSTCQTTRMRRKVGCPRKENHLPARVQVCRTCPRHASNFQRIVAEMKRRNETNYHAVLTNLSLDNDVLMRRSSVVLGVFMIFMTTGARTSATARSTVPRSPLPSNKVSIPPRDTFARKVLDEAPVPGRSRTTTSVPSTLQRPMERLGISGLVDFSRIYYTTESPNAMQDYVRAHLASGAKISTVATINSSKGAVSGLVVTLPTAGPNEYLAQIVYAYFASGIGSVLRIDAQTVWESGRTKTETIPQNATVELTGYARLSLANPSSGPSSIRLDQRKSAQLVAALNALPLAPNPGCHEDALLYGITVRASGAKQSYEVTGYGCGAPVEMSVDGHRLPALHDKNCVVLTLVKAFAPPKAVGTRRGVAAC